MVNKTPETTPSKSTLLQFMKEKGYSVDAVIRFAKSRKNRGLDPKQVERFLLANGKDKLRVMCQQIATLGHAHPYLSTLGDKVMLTGVDQLKSNTNPFSKRGFGSKNHPIKPRDAAAMGKAKTIVGKSWLSSLTKEQRREIASRGGTAAAKKRADKKAKAARRGPHWTQKPEHKAKKDALLAKMLAARAAKRAQSKGA